MIVDYSSDIREMILMNLDGWMVTDIPPEPEESVEDTVVSETGQDNSNDVEPFMTPTEIQDKPNKRITDNECRLFYEETLDQAYAYTNRLNIDDLTEIESRMFLRGVCKWTASNLWNKYNIRVNNEDMEDTYVQSYGGLLYKSALKTLQQFINQRVSSITSIKGEKDSLDDIWIM